MDLVLQGIIKAFHLLITGDPEVLSITIFSLQMSGSATIISLVIGVPAGLFLALKNFRGRNLILSIVNSAMGLPPVVVGLWVCLFLWRSGPLGFLNIIYTPEAIIVAQTIIALPVITGLTTAAIQHIDSKLRLQIVALGLTKRLQLYLLLHEVRLPLLGAVIAGFGSVISEVGASMMVGGNIRGYTRVLTTATATEVSKGNFDVAIALSIILSLLTYLITLWLTMFQQKRQEG